MKMAPNKVKIAYLGPAGTFTEQAMLQLVPALPAAFAQQEVEPVPVDSPFAALAAVRAQEVDFAVVAIENSVDGPINHTFDAISMGADVQIYAEVDLKIAFALLVAPGTRLEQIRNFATHPVAKAQVSRWLAANLPGATYLAATSNGAAAAAVAAGEVDAALAPRRAAAVYGLEVLAADLIDETEARTRFVLVGRPGPLPLPTGCDKSAIMFTTAPHQPGSLVAILQELASRGVNLTRIESRPTRRALGTYKFHVELTGHAAEPQVAAALQAVKDRADSYVFYGSWPGVTDPASSDCA